MKKQASELLNELIALSEQNSNRARILKTKAIIELNYKASPEKWSVLQCIDHLNQYGDYYLPAIARQLETASQSKSDSTFKSGLLGNYFANLMQVNEGNIKKMKSPKDKLPSASDLSLTTIDRFLKQQDRLLELLKEAQNKDLVKTKVSTSLHKLIRLRLGDTFRFFDQPHRSTYLAGGGNAAKKIRLGVRLFQDRKLIHIFSPGFVSAALYQRHCH
jgi:DinB superfamily